MKRYLFCVLIMYNLLHLKSTYATEPEKTVFPNGLTLIVKEIKQTDIVALTVFIKAGAYREPEERAGLAYFTQSMLLQGTTTKSAQEVALLSESIGASIYGSCTEDFATLSTVCFKKYFSQLGDIFFDVLLHPAFLQEEIEKERTTILAEIRQRQDHIFNVAFDELLENIYKQLPYHRPVAGYEKTVKMLQRQHVIDFYQHHYLPKNMIVTVVGNVSISEMKKIVEQYFPGMNTPVTPAAAEKETLSSLVAQNHRQEITIPAKFNQSYLMAGYCVPPVAAADYSVLKIIVGILSGGMNSRLFLYMREKEGLCYELSSFYPSRVDNSVFVIYLGLDQASLAKAKQLLQKEIQKLREEKITADELTKVKTYLAGTYILSRQKYQDCAFYFGFYETLGKGYEYDGKYITELESVTPEDIQRVARTYFTDDNLTTIELLPRSSKKGEQ